MTDLRIFADANMRGVEQQFGELGELRLVPGRDMCREQLQDADVLLVRSVTRVDELLLSGTPVRFVGTATAGVDHVDREYLDRRGISFAAAPGANANSVVDYVLAAIASCGDHLERLLDGGRVGIVGYGHVGRSLAAVLERLGIQCLACDPWLSEKALPAAATLEEVLQCQVVTLHAELTQRQPWPSYHLLGEGQLAMLSGGQLLINASRGAVVDNVALRRRLRASDSPDCVLDVWNPEPAIDGELFRLCRLGTAHIAGYSLDGKLRATAMLRRAAAAALGISADAASPPESVSVVTAFPGESALQALRRVLAEVVDIEGDSQRLAQVISAGNVAKGFDELRSRYRDRRELGNTVLRGGFVVEALPLLQAVGCRLEAEAR